MTDWPGDARTVEAWLRDLLQESADSPPVTTGLDRARVAVRLDGLDLADLTVDLTGVDIDLTADMGAPADPADDGDEPSDPDPTDLVSTPAMARYARFVAHPITVSGAAVSLDAEAYDVPIRWVSAPSSGERALLVDDRRDGARVRGSIKASISAADVVAAMSVVVAPLRDELGITLTRASVVFDQVDRETVRARIGGTLRRSFLRASGRVIVAVRTSRDGVVTIDDLRVRSRNPLVALGLLFVRKQIRALHGHQVDMNDHLPAGMRVTDAQVVASDDLTASARFA